MFSAPQRGKEVVKPWVSRGVFFGTFFLLMKRKYEHSRVNPSVTACAVPPPFAQGRLWCGYIKKKPSLCCHREGVFFALLDPSQELFGVVGVGEGGLAGDDALAEEFQNGLIHGVHALCAA